MKNVILLSIVASLFVACADNSKEALQIKEESKASYLQKLELDNNISYDGVVNTYGAYITSMCYTKTEDKTSALTSNPCYSCHTKGNIPNYYNDTMIQEEYNFPTEVMRNPFTNLFKDRSLSVASISDETILEYIRKSNYLDEDGNIILSKSLPLDWKGYKPDAYFNFDDEGFDRDNQGEYTLWRAFRYYPFLGTFWPTNGSTDDVLIRLDKLFCQNKEGGFDLEIYKLNLAIVESVVKQKDIKLTRELDEKVYGVDLNQNGVLDMSVDVKVSTYDKMSYVGMAKTFLEAKQINLALGLFPENTEFLHSVRYLNWDENTQSVGMSQRMKELRYAKKYAYKTYSEIQRVASAEFQESIALGDNTALMASFRGDYEQGLKNDTGWIYQGFIEDKNGELRPQTHEETINCMGCHSHLGATTDSIFSFARKFEGVEKEAKDFGWNHWSQKGLAGIKEPQAKYIDYGLQYEYSFYLQNNHSGNEFRNNDEVKNKFFTADGFVKEDMQERLHEDISVLLFPSYERAMALNKGYKVMVEEQSYIYGRDANVVPMENVFKEISKGQLTNISRTIVKEN